MGVESEREGEGGEENEDHILPNTSMIGRTLAIPIYIIVIMGRTLAIPIYKAVLCFVIYNCCYIRPLNYENKHLIITFLASQNNSSSPEPLRVWLRL